LIWKPVDSKKVAGQGIEGDTLLVVVDERVV
jgi:hypothetical protein